ncbi:unnamed protein product [Penicillium bialowiezense]
MTFEAYSTIPLGQSPAFLPIPGITGTQPGSKRKQRPYCRKAPKWQTSLSLSTSRCSSPKAHRAQHRYPEGLSNDSQSTQFWNWRSPNQSSNAGESSRSAQLRSARRFPPGPGPPRQRGASDSLLARERAAPHQRNSSLPSESLQGDPRPGPSPDPFEGRIDPRLLGDIIFLDEGARHQLLLEEEVSSKEVSTTSAIEDAVTGEKRKKVQPQSSPARQMGFRHVIRYHKGVVYAFRGTELNGSISTGPGHQTDWALSPVL